MKKRREQYERINGKRYIKNRNTKKEKGKSYTPDAHVRDVNSRRIFRDKTLTCQFLKDYSGIDFFSDLSPHDIEDVTRDYEVYLGVRFETDTVKKIRVRAGDVQQEVYVISLIEHKSLVDYDVQMQLLRYMSVIWYDYGKKQNKLYGKEVTGRKSFRYPLIIPIVYYEGKQKWTVDEKLWQRVELGEQMQKYIPDFSYKVVRIHDYTNDELKKHTNEISLVMMLNKIQSPEDYTEFFRTSKEYMETVLEETPQELLKILMDVFWALLIKMNVPQEEAKDLMEQMGVRNMGYLFENAEKMDIQAERRKTQEERKKREAAEKEKAAIEKEKAAIEKEREAAEKAEKIAKEKETKEKEKNENIIRNLIEYYQREGLTKEEMKVLLQKITGEKDLEIYFKETDNNAR